MARTGVTAFLGPAGEAGRLYFRGADTMMKGVHPAYRSAMRANLELAGFGVRRSRAALELGWKVSRSKSPIEAADHMARFWMSAFEDLMTVNGRAFEALTPSLPATPEATVEAVIEDWPAGAKGFEAPTETRRERDRLDVTERAKDIASAKVDSRVREAA